MRSGFALAGIVGGLLWIGLACVPPIGIRETRTYEIVWNRLWTPALVCMALGFISLFQTLRPLRSHLTTSSLLAMLIGLALMIVGNVSEYWLFSDRPHEGPAGVIRAVAWMSVLAGALVALVAATVTSVSMLYTSGIPRWLSLLFLLPLPLTVAIGFVSLNWAGTPLGFLSMIVGGFEVRTRSALGKMPHTTEARE